MKNRCARVRLAGLLAGLLTGVLLALAADLPAQVSRNVQLMAVFKPTSRYNDIWGYHTADGREYAILGATTGTYIVDCTNPAQPVQRAFFSAGASGWRTSTWRDMKTYGHYAYVVTEAGGGMKIIDLANPDKPKLIKTWGGTVWGNAHNIAMDTATGIAYPCGTRTGMHFIDVKTDPINPRYIGTFRSPYIHDLHIQNGYAHLAEIYGNTYMIVDVRSLPRVTTLARVKAPGRRYCHNTWATADDSYCLTSNETAGGPMGIFDIRNKRSPRLVATYAAGPSTAYIHNVFAKDRVAHISHYTEGYRAVDISDPTRPVEVGYYDTYPGYSSGYHGAWGCYPFSPSGIIYISDIEGGLFVLKPKATAARYGTGTPGTGGKIPVLSPFGAAYLGNGNFKLEVTGGKASATAYVVIGFAAANLNLGGLHIDVEMFTIPAAIIPAATNAAGKASVPIAIPNAPALNNVPIFVQWFVADANGALGLAASRGMKLELFTK